MLCGACGFLGGGIYRYACDAMRVFTRGEDERGRLSAAKEQLVPIDTAILGNDGGVWGMGESRSLLDSGVAGEGI